MTSDQQPREVCESVGGEDGQENREDREPPMLRNRPQEQCMCKTQADPGDPEHGDRDRNGHRLPSLRNTLEDEGQRNRGQKAGRHPRDAAQLGTEQAQHEARESGQDEWAERSRHSIELVQRDQPAGQRERPEPPAAEVHQSKHGGEQDSADDDPRPERAHLPPKRRSRLAYSISAARSSASPKSGQGVSTKTSSAYASCQSRKFEIR